MVRAWSRLKSWPFAVVRLSSVGMLRFACLAARPAVACLTVARCSAARANPADDASRSPEASHAAVRAREQVQCLVRRGGLNGLEGLEVVEILERDSSGAITRAAVRIGSQVTVISLPASAPTSETPSAHADDGGAGLVSDEGDFDEFILRHATRGALKPHPERS